MLSNTLIASGTEEEERKYERPFSHPDAIRLLRAKGLYFMFSRYFIIKF